MTTRITYATSNAPVKQVHVDNTSIDDGSGYLGLILNKNKNGKAVRIALRDGSQRVHVLLSDLPEFIKGLQLIADKGVKTSVDDIAYDEVA